VKMDFKSDLEYATSKLKIEFSFSDYQLKALKSLYDLKDTIAVLLTGSGKSIIFQGFRFLQSVQQTWRPDIYIMFCAEDSGKQEHRIADANARLRVKF
ncbi:hypothetical protein DPMN_157089, partial [Dreissena polymorpha]